MRFILFAAEAYDTNQGAYYGSVNYVQQLLARGVQTTL
jgi:hypothetical protein